ncbi:hypothetical protein [Actinoplanes sp. NPDC051494]|uniref:hypothetical protein n=1 Tax=Actinoplanes sp. NPDC051494 TaxID=3363907 RepID=UPI0037A988A9
MNARRVINGIAALTVGLLASSVPGPAPAQAAGNYWVYISAPTWQGNCPQGGSVKYMWAMISDSWSGGDAGDDLVYGRAYANVTQDVVTQPTCYNGSRSYVGPATSHSIRPTRNGQTWWMGPSGVSHN